LGYHLITKETFRKPIAVALNNYHKINGEITSINDLQLNLSNGDSKYPVFIGGYLHCGDDEENRPITSLSGLGCCYQRVWNRFNPDLSQFAEHSQRIYIKDEIVPHDKIYVPDEYINVVDNFANINMEVSVIGEKVEMILPYNGSIWAIGKVQKKDNRLYLTPEETVPHSLFLLYDTNPRYHFNLFSNAILLSKIFGVCSFILGFLSLGYGVNSLRKKWTRSN